MIYEICDMENDYEIICLNLSDNIQHMMRDDMNGVSCYTESFYITLQSGCLPVKVFHSNQRKCYATSGRSIYDPNELFKVEVSSSLPKITLLYEDPASFEEHHKFSLP